MFIYYSKEVWGESAAGGFSKRKPQVEYERAIVVTSPVKEIKQTVQVKISNQTMKSLNKIKLHTMTNGLSAGIYDDGDNKMTTGTENHSNLSANYH